MGKLILRDCDIVVDGVNLSDHISSVTINSSKDLVETTAFGDNYKTNLIGLGDGSIDLTMQQDFAAASVDATLWPIHDNEEEVVIVVKPTSGAVSPTNPSYTMTGVLPEFSPLSGDVGDVSTTDVTFQNSGSAGIVRATS